jgi:hypothetical protein
MSTESPKNTWAPEETQLSGHFARNTIFAKQSDKKINKDHVDSFSETNDTTIVEEQHMVLSLQDILESIPKNASSEPSPDNSKTHTEWRWRFFNLNGRKLVEISKLSPGEDRIYMDNTGKWSTYSLKKDWDQYITETKYCYVKD